MSDPTLTLLAIAIACGFALRWRRVTMLTDLARFGKWGADIAGSVAKGAEKKFRDALVTAGIAGTIGVAGAVTGGAVAVTYGPELGAMFAPDTIASNRAAPLRTQSRSTPLLPALDFVLDSAALFANMAPSYVLRIDPPAAPASPVEWASDFGTATGTSDNAVTDGDKWTGSVESPGGGDQLIVVTAPGGTCPNWPTDNALHTRSLNGDGGGGAIALNRIPDDTLAIGDSLTIRWYQCVVVPDSIPLQQNHGIMTLTSVGGQPWWQRQQTSGPSAVDGRWRPSPTFSPGNAPEQMVYDPVSVPVIGDYALAKDSTYMAEVVIHRTTATDGFITATYWRVDSGGLVEVLGEDDFEDGGTLMSVRTVGTFTGTDGIATLRAGNNGFDTGVVVGMVYDYQTAFAICRNQPCGVYVAGEGS